MIGGQWTRGVDRFAVLDKFTGATIAQCERASREQVDAAVAAARRSFEEKKLTPYERYEILMRASQLIIERGELLAETIVAEAGFPYVDAENEVRRAAQTFIVSAEEGKRLVGEVVPIEAAPGHAHRMAFTIRVPRGVVCGITSFNSPLNMVAHKVAPALAAGNTVVIKPPQATPLSAALLAQVLLDAGLPPSHVNLVQGPGSEVGGWLVANPDIAFYTFTGSTPVGKQLRDSVGLRPVALELGSIAATLVCDDADLDRAATRCVQSAFRRAGQACTSIQRLFVDRKVIDAFVPRLLAAARALKVGDPHDRATVIGPMISERDAARAESWVQEAVAAGRASPAGRLAPGRAAAADDPRRGDAEHARHVRGSVRAGDVDRPGRRTRRRGRPGELDAVRPRRRHLHARRHARPECGTALSCRRRAHQRTFEQPRRPDAVFGRQGQRRRHRGPALRDARNDRGAPDHGEPLVTTGATT